MANLTYFSDDSFEPSQDQADALVHLIVENYKNWDNDRNSQREQYEKIVESLYLDVTHNERNNDETILLPQIYEQFNTLKSSIIKSNFQNLDMTFNVEGEDQQSQDNATLQKANIKEAMRMMKFPLVAEDAIDHLLTKGEMIGFTYWETVVENCRRMVTQEVPVGIHPETGEEITNSIEQLTMVPKKIFDGAKVEPVDPLCFVFDKNMVKNWDSCMKITYTLSNPMDILANDGYRKYLTAEMQEFLLGVVTNDENLTSEKYYQEAYSGINGNQVNVMECWGDIPIGDGMVLKNYVATVIADMFLVRLEPNPYVRNPFTYYPFMPDPSSQRGRSPLLVAIPINQVSSQILNGQVRGMKLSLNPPVLAPMDFFTQDRIALYPGKVVEYNDLYNGARPPQPYSFKDGMIGFDFLTFFENKIEGATGAFKYMVGAQDNRTRTATETSATVTGQNTRLSMMITQMNERWTVPTIENIAALQANTDFKDKEINTGRQDGLPQFGTITPDIRQGNYRYIYGDSQSVVEMEAKMQKITNLLAPFAGKAEIDYNGLVQLIFKKMNIEDADIILTPDPIDQAIQQMSPKPLPPQMITQMKKEFVDSGMLQQVLQQMTLQMQQGAINGQEPNQGMVSQNVGTPQQSDMAGTSPMG